MKLLSKLSIFVCAILISACATSPEGRMQFKLFPSQQMDKLGVQSFSQIKTDTPRSQNAATVRYIECIANHIIPQLDKNNNPDNWEVVVFADQQANAFALPGNKIGVYEGLLEFAVNQHQVAAVMGHEVAHVIAQHGNERISGQIAAKTGLSLAALALGKGEHDDSLLLAGLGLGVQYGVILPFSRAHESEADLIGLGLMARAGFKPAESIKLWQNMSASGLSPPEFMSTHPSGKTRIAQLTQRMQSANTLYQQARAQGKTPNCKR